MSIVFSAHKESNDNGESAKRKLTRCEEAPVTLALTTVIVEPAVALLSSKFCWNCFIINRNQNKR
jgi:hypothetical protein